MLLDPAVALATSLLLLGLPAAHRQARLRSTRVAPPEAPLLSSSLAAQHPEAVAVADAGHKGRGLFAKVDIPEDTYLCDYAGELLSERQLSERYAASASAADGSRYVVAVASPFGEPWFVDAREEEQVSPGRWLNHATDGTLACNVGNACYFPLEGLDVRLCMVTLRDVRAGEELQWDYGDSYWEAVGERPA